MRPRPPTARPQRCQLCQADSAGLSYFLGRRQWPPPSLQRPAGSPQQCPGPWRSPRADPSSENTFGAGERAETHIRPRAPASCWCWHLPLHSWASTMPRPPPSCQAAHGLWTTWASGPQAPFCPQGRSTLPSPQGCSQAPAQHRVGTSPSPFPTVTHRHHSACL